MMKSNSVLSLGQKSQTLQWCSLFDSSLLAHQCTYGLVGLHLCEAMTPA